MFENTDMLQTYLTIGAGGLCVLTVVCIFIFMVMTSIKKIIPRLESVEQKLDNLEGNQKATNEIMRSNNDIMSKCVDVMSNNQKVVEGSQKALENNTKAMNNFSEVLRDLMATITTLNDGNKRIERSTNDISREMIKMSERIKWKGDDTKWH